MELGIFPLTYSFTSEFFKFPNLLKKSLADFTYFQERLLLEAVP